jgi:hypothetical protein
VRGDKGDNIAEKFTWTPAETEPRQQDGQLGGKCRMTGKLPRMSEYVVADAVAVEPASSRKIPSNREISVNFGERATPGGLSAHDLTNKFNHLIAELPNRETGNFFSPTG